MRRLIFRRHDARERQLGAYAVEFALVFPVLSVLLFGTIEGGRFVVARQMLSYAAVCGARAATLRGASTGSVQTAVIGSAPMLGLNASQIGMTVPGGFPATVGSTVIVTIGVTAVYTFHSFLPTRFTTRNWTAQATEVVR